MTDPSRTTPAASDQASTDSEGPLDPTLSRPRDEPNFAAPAHAGEVGQLGRYRVLQKLGAGGMGAVYLGFDAALERKVALKVMLPQHAADRGARDRFLREARAAAKVHSDHVVTIHDVGEERGVPFIAMEYLLGSPLDKFLKQKGDLALQQALRVVRETALGLSAAHALGLVHRDIKPGNIWLEAPKGRVKILDFGLARAANDDAHITNSGAVVGTPAYMSPEQGRGLKVDHRTDLFSLGVVLYRLTTGKMPFTGDGAMAVLTSLAVDTPVPPRQLNPHLPEAIEAVINRLLAKNPAERFQTAKEVIAALTEIEQPRSGSGQLPVVVAVPVPPLAVSVQTQNVWEGIDASESVPVPLATSVEAPAEAPSEPKPYRKARGGSKWPLFAALAAVLAAGAAVAVVVASLSKKPETVQKDDPPPSDKPRPPVQPPKKDDKKDDKQPAPKAEGTVYPLPADLIAPMTPVKTKEVFSLDHLDPANPKHIPPEEKYDWQPKELVAVLGSHRQRFPGSRSNLAISPDGKVVLASGFAIDVASRRFLDWPAVSVFSPDGKHGASGNKVYDLTDPKKPPVEYPGVGSIYAFLTADSVLAAGEGGYVVWKLAPTGSKPLEKFAGVTFAVSNDRKYLAVTFKNDPPCRVYDVTLDGPKERFVLPGPEGKVKSLNNTCISDTGLLVAQDATGSVRVWDLTGAVPQLRASIEPQAGDGVVGAYIFSKGDLVIRVLLNGGAEVWSIQGEKPQRITGIPTRAFAGRFGSNFAALTITPDGQTIITGHEDGVVRFWGIEKGVTFEKNPLKPQPTVDPRFADLSPDGRFAALHHEDGQSHLWNLGDLAARPLDWTREGMARFSSDGSLCTSTNEANRTGLRIVPPLDQPGKPPVDFGAGFIPLRYSPDGKWLAAATGTEVAIWDVSASPPKELWRVSGSANNVWRFTPDGRYLLSCGQATKIWAMTGRGPVLRQEITIPTQIFALSPDCKTAVVYHAGVPAHYELKDGVLSFVRTGPGHADVHWIDFSPDSRAQLVGGSAGLKLRDALTEKVIWERPLRGAPQGGRFHPDGRHVLVTNADRTTYVLRLPKEVLERLNDPDRRAAEYVLSIGGGVGVNVNGEARSIKAVADLPKDRFSLTGVNTFETANMTDAGLANLKGCRNLIALTLTGPFTDAGLANLQDCKGLTHLDLRSPDMTDAGLAHFRDFEQLAGLTVIGPHVTDSGMANFGGCKSLRGLGVSGPRVTAAVLAHFKDCKYLEGISLPSTQVTDEGLAAIKGFEALARLTLGRTRVTDAGLKLLTDCKKLEALHLDETQVTDTGLAVLKGVPTLTHLDVRKTRVTAAGVAEFAKALPGCRILWDGGTIDPKK